MISPSRSSASVDSTFEMMSGGGADGSGACFAWQSVMCARMASTPAALRTKEAATMSMSCSMPKRMSSRSLSESGGRSVTMPTGSFRAASVPAHGRLRHRHGGVAPGRFTPFRSPMGEVLSTSHATPPSGRTSFTRSETSPSSSSTTNPGETFDASRGYPTKIVCSSPSPSYLVHGAAGMWAGPDAAGRARAGCGSRVVDAGGASGRS